ncbi:hypothetical protein D3C81_1117160 [compost metagenome]
MRALICGSRLWYFTWWATSARSSQEKPRLTNSGRPLSARPAAWLSATWQVANHCRSKSYCAWVELCRARSRKRNGPLPGRFASPTTPAELSGISQPSTRTCTPSRALASSNSPMLGALPSRMKYIEGWKPQQMMSIDFRAAAMARCTARNVSSPLTSGW